MLYLDKNIVKKKKGGKKRGKNTNPRLRVVLKIP